MILFYIFAGLAKGLEKKGKVRFDFDGMSTLQKNVRSVKFWLISCLNVKASKT